ncbi:hypothetical protein RHGRI_011708 [Rhododendron griersonianum]|uniref:Uncharacterized protein n=1 Tax=Rhododendron griersonianum TaxID=479676 RepID=A0AAV6KNZ3_9ERIC|nr:hypothetical protein RHGRI_011708 [Rhododendron griersonianum]
MVKYACFVVPKVQQRVGENFCELAFKFLIALPVSQLQHYQGLRIAKFEMYLSLIRLLVVNQMAIARSSGSEWGASCCQLHPAEVRLIVPFRDLDSTIRNNHLHSTFLNSSGGAILTLFLSVAENAMKYGVSCHELPQFHLLLPLLVFSMLKLVSSLFGTAVAQLVFVVLQLILQVWEFLDRYDADHQNHDHYHDDLYTFDHYSADPYDPRDIYDEEGESLCITESIFVGAYSGAAHEVCKQGLVRMGVQFWSLIPISVTASRSLQLFEFILIPLLTKVLSVAVDGDVINIDNSGAGSGVLSSVDLTAEEVVLKGNVMGVGTNAVA